MKEPNGTIEIYIQGGIIAANGMQSIFKVYPVQMVPKKPKLKKDNKRGGQHRRSSAASPSFGDLLENIAPESAPAECYMVTYTADSRLQIYNYYNSREYTF